MIEIALQIDGKWAVLPDDTEISVEENSPIFGEGNTYSFPFELNIEENRHIIGNSDQISGESLYKVLDKKDAVLYAGGIPFFYGIISLEDEIEVNDGKVEVSLISSTLAFDDMFQDMNCRDVPLKDEIIIGTKWDEAYYNATGEWDVSPKTRIYIPSSFVEPYEHIYGMSPISTLNVSDAYPKKPYCNIRIAYPAPEKPGEPEDPEDPESPINPETYIGADYVSQLEKGSMYVLDVERNLSAPSFYVMYFLECLFSHKNMVFNFNNITKNEEDLCRLALINVKCFYRQSSYAVGGIRGQFKLGEAARFSMRSNSGFPMPRLIFNTWADYFSHDNIFEVGLYPCYATSDNFPDAEVESLLDVLRNMLRLCFLYNQRTKEIDIVFTRDVLKDNHVKTFSCEILSLRKKENPINGYRLTYDGDEDDTSYNYKDWDNPEMIESYNKMLSGLSATNKTLYIDSRNGNAYRVKIDKDATSIEKAKESWFEVGQYIPVEYGDCSVEEKTEECVLNFTPLTVNDATGHDKIESLKSKIGLEEINDIKDNDQQFALFLDVEMEFPYPQTTQLLLDWGLNMKNNRRTCGFQIKVAYADPQRYNFDISTREVLEETDYYDELTLLKDIKNYPTEDKGSPIQNTDLGITLGIMRGPGNQSGREDYEKDYDDEGNEKYRIVPKNYAMHSDSVDNYARVFDYNGTGDGGVDVTNRFSLKIKAEKPVATASKEYRPCSLPECAERGLFDKFHKEYAHFVTNRKIAIFELRMELADLISIDWKSRYTIGGITGFINKYSYSISNHGISTVTVELYYL